MTIFTPQFHPPLKLETEQFILFPTDASLFESDFKAVMKSRDSLRIWSQSSWPEDDFTPEQNREDLKQHVNDNRAHTAYGYMIYSPDRQNCYGSLYVNPLTSVSGNYVVSQEEADVLKTFDVRIDCWITQGLDRAFETHALMAIRAWLHDEWKVRSLFAARIGMDRRREIYEQMGLTMRLNVRSSTSNMNLLLFG